jgi:hypothetical protein
MALATSAAEAALILESLRHGETATHNSQRFQDSWLNDDRQGFLGYGKEPSGTPSWRAVSSTALICCWTAACWTLSCFK